MPDCSTTLILKKSKVPVLTALQQGSILAMQISPPLTTTDSEVNGNRDLACILTTNSSSMLKQTSPPPSSLVTKPVTADYQLPVLETSTLFLVQKENGEFCPVINLRALN